MASAKACAASIGLPGVQYPPQRLFRSLAGAPEILLGKDANRVYEARGSTVSRPKLGAMVPWLRPMWIVAPHPVSKQLRYFMAKMIRIRQTTVI